MAERDVADVVVGCDCGKERPLYEALKRETLALGYCNGKRPWLGAYVMRDTGIQQHSLRVYELLGEQVSIVKIEP